MFTDTAYDISHYIVIVRQDVIIDDKSAFVIRVRFADTRALDKIRTRWINRTLSSGENETGVFELSKYPDLNQILIRICQIIRILQILWISFF